SSFNRRARHGPAHEPRKGGVTMFAFQEDLASPVKIKVSGVGGAGCNAVNTMITAGLARVDFIAANTDLQALERSRSPYKVQLGPERTRGLGAGAKPEVGKDSALESKDHIRECLEGSDMVFVTAGGGGGSRYPSGRSRGSKSDRRGR